MDLPAIARLVQTMLYGKRFFPFYTYVIRESSALDLRLRLR
jgi:20S proteasome subunit beta 6